MPLRRPYIRRSTTQREGNETTDSDRGDAVEAVARWLAGKLFRVAIELAAHGGGRGGGEEQKEGEEDGYQDEKKKPLEGGGCHERDLRIGRDG